MKEQKTNANQYAERTVFIPYSMERPNAATHLSNTKQN